MLGTMTSDLTQQVFVCVAFIERSWSRLSSVALESSGVWVGDQKEAWTRMGGGGGIGQMSNMKCPEGKVCRHRARKGQGKRVDL